MSEQQQIYDERYAECIAALMDAACCGVNLKTLQTMKFEMNIDSKDYKKVMDAALSKRLMNFAKGKV